RPIGCAINFWCRLIHLKIILWNKPLEIGLCNKASLIEKNSLEGFKYFLEKNADLEICIFLF
ncbi:MAG: hypothetical protein E6Z89_17930, partial [Acinetobacter sp.]|nr:hypothetical protein [Acinetobacter sp.]